MKLTHTATRAGRLSSFLRGELQMSYGLMNKLKWGDSIRVNGTAQHTDFAVSIGDVITVQLPDATADYPAEPGELTVLYEDAHLIAVDKPAGMLIHPSHSCNTGTLANRVLGHYQQNGEQALFHPITRLDRDTFGVVLIAKNAHISQLLQSGAMTKVYHAITFGGPADEDGIIDAPIARKPLPSLLREIREDGKPSITKYRVLERSEKLCKLELQPITGRTHQLRLHCAHMGFPIVGDLQYNSAESAAFSAQLGLKTQLLCAAELTFPHPMTGQTLTVRSTMLPEINL